MRTQQKNKIKIKYALLLGVTDEIELDDKGNPVIDYIDEDGKVYFRYTGEKQYNYSEPIEIMTNFSMSGGESEAVSFGVDISSYDAVITTEKRAFPITETSLIWVSSDVAYKDANKTIIDSKSADYTVSKVSDTLNVTKYILNAVVK